MRRKVGAMVLPALLVAFIAVQAHGAGPSIMPGFPLRAGNNVMIMWLPVPGASTYGVFRSETSGGPYQKIGEGPATNFMDPNVPQDKSFYYVVKPLVGGKEGESSPEVSIKGIEPMKAPVVAAHLITSDNKIALRWDVVKDAVFYNVFRADSEKAEPKLLTSAQDVKFTDTDVKVGATYLYTVSAVNSANVESPRSEVYTVKLVAQAKAGGGAGAEENLKAVKLVDYFDGDADAKVFLSGPRDIDVDGNGNFYVTNGNGLVFRISKEMKVTRIFGIKPVTYQGSWTRAEGIFFDRKNGTLYICFPMDQAVRTFDANGDLLREFFLRKPAPGTKPDLSFNPYPLDVAVGKDGTIWVNDAGYSQLVGFNERGEEVKRVGLPKGNPDREKDKDSLSTPGMLAVSPSTGNLFVSENLLQRVAVIGPDGHLVGHVGGRGERPGQFIQLGGLGIGEDGVVYVGDRNLHRLQSFKETGEYLATYYNPKVKNEKERTWLGVIFSGLAVSGNTLYVGSNKDDRVRLYTTSE